MFKKNIIVITLAVQGLLVILLAYQAYSLSNRLAFIEGKLFPKRQQQQEGKAVLSKSEMDEMVKSAHHLGNKDARVTIALFNSFSCFYCKKVGEPLKQLAAKYPDDVKLAYMHFNRNSHDESTAQTAECAGEQGKFWQMYDELFANGSAAPDKQAANVGLNRKQFETCMKSKKYDAKIVGDTQRGIKLGINGTPSFLINGKLFVGYKPLQEFERIVQVEMK